MKITLGFKVRGLILAAPALMVGMTDLNSLVNLRDGVIITNASGINNFGQVISVSLIPSPSRT